jgi:cytochrome c biogenesis protein CcdA
MASNASRAPQHQTLRYGLLVLAVVVLAIAGYAGYALYPRFNLPAASGIGLLILAAAAGIASFFSPCSFSLLATLLARESGVRPGQHGSTARALRFAGALAFGAALFLLLAGVVIALGGSALFAGVTFTSMAGRSVRTIVGLVLIVLGAIQLGVLPLSFHGASAAATPMLRRQAQLRREHPTLAFGVYGFAYLLAGFG